jgi:hypothetical protein
LHYNKCLLVVKREHVDVQVDNVVPKSHPQEREDVIRGRANALISVVTKRKQQKEGDIKK